MDDRPASVGLEHAALPSLAGGTARSLASSALNIWVVTPAVIAIVAPACPTGKLCLVVRSGKTGTAATEARYSRRFLCQIPPTARGFWSRSAIHGIAVLLAAPTQLRLDCSPPMRPFFHQSDLQSPPCEIIGCKDTDDAANDNDGIRGVGQFRRGRYLCSGGRAMVELLLWVLIYRT